ncbi:ensconsin isoform X3 [Lacerta agilis]|uniref:ensconsin isoform X3 n=1 Tax=Lacerta agilis TaxID=80427 RepID=UPI00141A01EC|nr:ensconsin isoform X3 [Lacerta agilis]
MPGSATAIRQERLKKAGVRPNTPVLFTINEEDEQQKNGNSKRLKVSENSKVVQDKKPAPSSRPTSAALGQNASSAGAKPDPAPVLKVDERQRLARERREEREKLLAAREAAWVEKEERARQYYEKHLEERKKKLEEQRLKEERRRAAVEEKRRQRIEEDKERHEAVVRRTIERSQKPKQKQNRWSWGGTLHNSSSINNTGYFVESSFTFLDLAGLEYHFRPLGGARKPDPDRRSVSTMNLSKHVDPVINKRLSSSSATLLNSPDRARRLQLSPWESSVVSRLLTPTHSFLARSKSAATLSGDAASCSPISPLSFKAVSCRNPADRAKLFGTTPDVRRRRTAHSAGMSRKEKEKVLSLSNPPGKKRSRSPATFRSKSAAWHASRSLPFLPGTPKKVISAHGSSRISSAQQRPPSPGNIRPTKNDRKVENVKKEIQREPEKTTEEKTDHAKATFSPTVVTNLEALPCKTETTQIAAPVLPSAPSVASPPPICSKPSAGTTDAEEATRLLSEKRRLAREQREREEQERREREETERLILDVHRQKKEELAQRIAEERARREEEAQKQEAERKQKEAEHKQEEEEQLCRLAEEKEKKEREEMEHLQKQKEEEARLREEQIRLEREKHFQREEQERLERKKRLEEIMKRTRRTEAAEKKSNEQQNGEIAKETAVSTPLSPAMGSQVQCVPESPRNGELLTHTHVLISHQPTVNLDSNLNPGKHPNENGVSMQNDNFEEVISLPMGTKPSRLDAMNNDDKNSPDISLTPILAFEEKGTLGPLPQKLSDLCLQITKGGIKVSAASGVPSML